MIYQKFNQLKINKVIQNMIYEYVRKCDSDCTEMIQFFEF
ncbi:MAG: hypothetical protein JWP78_2472 [Mucilaginibacter sp.]|nr:hypothetical protein [Mucilaginibacter sp.]